MSCEHDTPASRFRAIPSVHALAERLATSGAARDASPAAVTAAARQAIEAYRDALRAGTAEDAGDVAERLLTQACRHLTHATRPPLTPAINATGIILHTGLGRAPLAPVAAEHAAAVAGHYAPVELALETGKRGHRADVVEPLLRELTGAEAATIVNNNAAALLLVLATLAANRHVVISRGELIEIGGSFRLPDVCAASSGALLREVGTTNRTRLGDYEAAIDTMTGVLLKIHPSNFRVQGFTEAVSIAELAALARPHELAVVHDIGSGALRPTAAYGWPSDEPDASSSIADGADVVLFSGDKLLGGPQAGIIVGTRRWIDAINRHPLTRAVRVDKITLAALGATLALHRDPRVAAEQVPVLRMLTTPPADVERRAVAVADALRGLELGDTRVEVRATVAHLGGGALPTEAIASSAVVVSGTNAEDIALRLRSGSRAVITRAKEDAIWLDLRTVLPGEEDELVAAVRTAAVG